MYSAEPRGKRAPIDLFFRSLAERHGGGCAVILTGRSDGTVGVRAVKESGGIILVQDPNEAGCGRCRGYQFDNGHAIGVDARAKSA